MFANFLYACLLTLVSPIIAYRMIRFGRYKRGVGEKFLGLSCDRANQIRGDKKGCLWIHAVSVGEVNLLPSLVAKLKERRPDLAVAISTSTDTGYDLAVKSFGKDNVFFFPLDFTWAVSRTLANLKPEQLILTELELWPNLVRLATDQGCPVRIINGRLSEKSAASYQRFAKFIRPTFARFDWVGCQDEEIKQRFEECGVPANRMSVTGSIKFDNAPHRRDTETVMRLSQWSGIDPWQRVWIMGSTQEGEEAIALSVYQRLTEQQPELRLVIVPRHVERFDAVADLIKAKGFIPHRRSSDPSLHRQGWEAERVILVDTIGELRDWWGVGPIATVGGSFGSRGGQNMLEPAGYGSAVSFGPNTKNFRVIADGLIAAGGAVRVADEEELHHFVRRCLNNIPAADSLGRSAQTVVESHRGATKRTLDALVGKVATIKNRAA
ncbi:3-deoxy-D-manno-octulosonic acid transferase [Rubripirellula obstinata]|uniref:3-deoxy-D-manno-octulosonic acid transferase n=1 Tax=Rubripirellula obstinata TaxID=406547 RepID=A0A5B1CNL2_9BACT|nr:3-deoxy-D-manno-octulosonic acid transferase [Rubripirellula obstinata]KAA1261952.1 3-deoxy-D-manno-octulosonic acid transferase [Rubripirellula obstinata]